MPPELADWHACYLALALAAMGGLATLFGVAAIYGEALFLTQYRPLRVLARSTGSLWGVVFGVATLLLAPTPLAATMLGVWGPGAPALVLLAALVVGALVLWRLLTFLAVIRHDQRQATAAAGRDKTLERQMRALVREQRALHRRQQELTRPGEKPPGPPR
ncbi:MAG: hypothetical protein M3Z04_06375 [Chloroflexota bacterium]|nr:hypothetical protein [Chloroflexota bacterium]